MENPEKKINAEVSNCTRYDYNFENDSSLLPCFMIKQMRHEVHTSPIRFGRKSLTIIFYDTEKVSIDDISLKEGYLISDMSKAELSRRMKGLEKVAVEALKKYLKPDTKQFLYDITKSLGIISPLAR